MKLPINVKDILGSGKVEWERLEFKEGWNSLSVLHTLCAFANDFHNLGGGYIVIGVAEDKGCPILPPKGIAVDKVDSIQKEIMNLGHKIVPYYHPIIAPCEIQDKTVLVLWAAGGQTRPYKAPISMSKNCKEYAYYIRKGSQTIRAKHQDEVELIGLAATVPFDDRINQRASFNDLDLGLIRAYLQQVGSDLFDEAPKMDFVELCRRMNIVDGADEHIFPRNVGLMFFNAKPDLFFPQAQIDVVNFPEGPGADSFSEKIFKGPVNHMLTEALNHIKDRYVEERIQKFPDRAEAERRYNYPYVAIEEILTNAVYHRAYEVREPIEVRIFPDKITIGSFPGPDRSIADKDIAHYRFISRRYRNRRIGEFFKELDMTEGRGTGVPKILQAIKKNESPLPIFHTDEDRTYFVVELPIHSKFIKKVKSKTEAQSGAQSGAQSFQVLAALQNKELSVNELVHALGLKNKTGALKRTVSDLLERKWIAYTIPDKPNSRLQKYRLTKKGNNALVNSVKRGI
ncbi:MAG: RNA-binding domain-containing protein [Candidatus Omnitrophota bacterium]